MLRRISSIVVVPVFLLVWSQFGAQNLTSYSFHALIDYPSPYLAPLAPGKDGDQIAKQVVLVVVDALRADTARTLPGVNSLRQKGADRNMTVGQPSLSLPGWTVIGTGAWQEQSGVTLNFYSQDIKLDTIFEAAKRKGLATAIVGAGGGWKQLYTRGIDWNESVPTPKNEYSDLAAVRRQDDEIEATALRIMKEKQPNLLLVHFAEPDDAGHAHGAASPQYREAALAEDGRFARLAAVMDLTQSTILVTGDHGMLDRGGHGGWETEVMTVALIAAGKGIKPGMYANAYQVDIAPTLAALLGTSFPAHNQGIPMFDMLEMSVPQRASRGVDTARQISDRYAVISSVLRSSPFDHEKLNAAIQALNAGNAESAFQAAMDAIGTIRAQAANAKQRRLNEDRLARLPLSFLLLVPFVIYALVMRQAKWNWLIPIVGTVVYFLVFYLLFIGGGYYFSLSIFNTEERILSFFTARTVDAMIALAIASAVVGVLSQRASRYHLILDTINAAFLITFVLTIQILIFYVLYSIDFAWYLPDLALGFKYYLDVLQTGAFWPMPAVPLLVLLPFIALAARWAVSRLPFSSVRRVTPQPKP